MKALILAAGEGTRLRPLTESVPKCLLPVRGVPLLETWLENCAKAGINCVLVNAHAHAEAIRRFVTEQKTGVRVHVAEEQYLLGSAGTLAENRSFFTGEKAFFVFYGDVLTNVDLRRMLEFHEQKRLPITLGIHQVPDPTRCGIVDVDSEFVIQSFVEKPARPAGRWAFSGVMVAGQEIFDLLPEHRPADIGFHVLPKLAGRMAAYRIAEYLVDIGTLDNYYAVQESWPSQAIAGLNEGVRMLAGVIFDFDGVIVDSHPVHLEAWRAFFSSIGKEIPDQELAFVLEGGKREEILRHFLGELDEHQIKVYGEAKQRMFQQREHQMKIVRGFVNFLAELKSAGFPVAIATSGSRRRVEHTLELLGLRHRFGVMVTGEDVSLGKPDPALFLLAAQGLQLKAGNILVCEDAVSGVVAAKAAGMKCLAVAANGRRPRLKEAGADIVIEDFTWARLEDIGRLFAQA